MHRNVPFSQNTDVRDIRALSDRPHTDSRKRNLSLTCQVLSVEIGNCSAMPYTDITGRVLLFIRAHTDSGGRELCTPGHIQQQRQGTIINWPYTDNRGTQLSQIGHGQTVRTANCPVRPYTDNRP